LQNVAYAARSEFVQETDAICNAVAYMLKLTVRLNKPLLLNTQKKDLWKFLQCHKLQALRQVVKHPER